MSSYQGYGFSSVDPVLLERFAPKPIKDDKVRSRIESLFDIRHDPHYVILSPMDERIFFSWNITGTLQVWYQDRPKSFPVQLTTGTMSSIVRAVLKNGLLVMERDRDGEENPGVYIMSDRGGEVRVVQHVAHIQTHYVGMDPDERIIYIQTNDQSLDAYRILGYDLEKNTMSVIFDRPGLWSVADVAGDGVLLLMRSLSNTAFEYATYEPKKNIYTPMIGQGEMVDYQARFGRTSRELIVATTKFDNYRRLYRFVDGAWSPLTPEEPFEIDDFMVSKSHSRVVYAVNEHGYMRVKCLDLGSGYITTPLLPDSADIVTPRDSSEDGVRSVLNIRWSDRPSTNVIYDWQAHTMTPLMIQSMPEIDIASIAKPRLITIAMRDGSVVPAFVREPITQTDNGSAPYSVIVSFHGGPEEQSLSGYDTQCQLFVASGYVVIEPNVRGSSGYGKAYLDADNGRRRLEVITDIEDVARYARATYTKNGQAPRVGVFGGSYGGYSTLLAMTKFAGAYDTGVSLVGISNLITFLNNTAPYRQALRFSEYGHPEKDREALIELSPSTYVDRITDPLLIIQGATDPRVPAGEAIAMYEAVLRRKVPTELIIFPDEGHGMRKRTNRVMAYGAIISFFDRYLKQPC